MKISISVPDDLWIGANYIVEEPSPSALVQRALRALIKAEGPEHLEELRRFASEKSIFQAQAKEILATLEGGE